MNGRSAWHLDEGATSEANHRTKRNIQAGGAEPGAYCRHAWSAPSQGRGMRKIHVLRAPPLALDRQSRGASFRASKNRASGERWGDASSTRQVPRADRTKKDLNMREMMPAAAEQRWHSNDVGSHGSGLASRTPRGGRRQTRWKSSLSSPDGLTTYSWPTRRRTGTGPERNELIYGQRPAPQAHRCGQTGSATGSGARRGSGPRVVRGEMGPTEVRACSWSGTAAAADGTSIRQGGAATNNHSTPAALVEARGTSDFVDKGER